MAASVKFRLSVLAALLIALTGLLVAHAAADSPQSIITVSPTVQRLTLGPGLVQATTNVQVANHTDHRLTATVQLVDFKTLNENGGLTLGQVGVPLWKFGLASWMQVSSNKVSLAPGESTKLVVTIQNREDLTPGGHYGAVVINADSPSASGTASNQVSFSQNLVSLLFVKKLGGEVYGLQLRSLTAEQGHELPQSVTTDFASTGNVYVIPRGYIEVTDPHGKLIQKGIINQESNMIIQDTHEKLITLLQPVAHSSAGGRYKITAHYRYDGQAGYSTKTLYFTRSSDLTSKLKVIVLTGAGALLLVYLVRRWRPKKYRAAGRRSR